MAVARRQEISTKLLEAGASFNVRTRSGQTPWLIAQKDRNFYFLNQLDGMRLRRRFEELTILSKAWNLLSAQEKATLYLVSHTWRSACCKIVLREKRKTKSRKPRKM